MEEINLKELLEYFGKHIWQMTLGIIIIAGLGFGYVFYVQKPMYQASTTLLLATESTVITQGEVLLNRSLINTYREVVKSNKVLYKTLEDTDLSLEKAQLAKMVEVTAPPNTDVLKITVKSDNKRIPHLLADSLASNFKELVQDVYLIENIAIVDEAEPAYTPYNKNIVLQSTIISLIAILTTAFMTLLIYFLDDTIKDEITVEETTKVPVIGIIPLEKEVLK